MHKGVFRDCVLSGWGDTGGDYLGDRSALQAGVALDLPLLVDSARRPGRSSLCAARGTLQYRQVDEIVINTT